MSARRRWLILDAAIVAWNAVYVAIGWTSVFTVAALGCAALSVFGVAISLSPSDSTRNARGQERDR